MTMSFRRLVQFLAIGAAVVIGSIVVNSYYHSGDEVCADPGGCPHSCPNEVCVSACWADGTYFDPHSCTKVKNTVFAPIECDPGGGCITQSCN